MQIQQTAVQSQRALNASLQQSSSKDRERRILQLTIDEISQMKGDVKMYKGIGKMSVICLCDPPKLWSYHCPCRFMHVPRSTMEAELKSQEKDISDDIANLNKKAGFIYHLP
jgi:prefoldin subunit 1